VIRLLRILRIVRLFKRLSHLQRILNCIFAALVNVFHAFTLFYIILRSAKRAVFPACIPQHLINTQPSNPKHHPPQVRYKSRVSRLYHELFITRKRALHHP